MLSSILFSAVFFNTMSESTIISSAILSNSINTVEPDPLPSDSRDGSCSTSYRRSVGEQQDQTQRSSKRKRGLDPNIDQSALFPDCWSGHLKPINKNHCRFFPNEPPLVNVAIHKTKAIFRDAAGEKKKNPPLEGEKETNCSSNEDDNIATDKLLPYAILPAKKLFQTLSLI